MALPLAVIVGAYLLGSIPFSFLVVKAFTGADIRQHGSRNVGATNVARNFGKLPGILALILDAAKGYAAVWLARWLTTLPQWPFAPAATPVHSREFWVGLAAFVAVLGHMFPLWLGFHGGKGVATATGAFLALSPIVVAAGAIVFAIVVLATRFISLGSIVSAASIPVFFRFLANGTPFWHTIFSIFIAIAVILKHHSNIARLAQRKERRMGEPKEPR